MSQNGGHSSPGQFWHDVRESRSLGPQFDLLRLLLSGAAGLYSAGLKVYLDAERTGLRRRTILPAPTISIGNLTSGGSGKTPMTQYVCELLLNLGVRPVVLSRGHGGSRSSVGAQVSDGRGNLLLSTQESGDEAMALAKLLPDVPVYIGKDRRRSGAAALEYVRPDAFVLDDALQYWQLARDLDIVLLDSRRPFDNGRVLPRGLLREPKEHLRRAGIIVITRADMATDEELDDVQSCVHSMAPDVPLFTSRHCLRGFRPLNEAAFGLTPQRSIAVCGIAQPEAFRAMLERAETRLTPEMLALPDHAAYTEQVMQAIEGKIGEQGALSVITTEKDAVKMAADRLSVPVFAAGLRLEIDEPDLFERELLTRSRLRAEAGEPTPGQELHR